MNEKQTLIEPSGITVDEEGNWFYQGNPIIREDILQLFYEHLKVTPGNGYFIEWQGKLNSIDVADTPFVITRVDWDETPQGINNLWITLKHLPEKEILDPSTLFINDQNVLYCKIRNGLFTARFSRPAYYQIAQLIEEENGAFVIKVGSKKFSIKTQ